VTADIYGPWSDVRFADLLGQTNPLVGGESENATLLQPEEIAPPG